jgi:hypothetical protein
LITITITITKRENEKNLRCARVAAVVPFHRAS